MSKSLHTQPLVAWLTLYQQRNRWPRKAVESILGATQSPTLHILKQAAVANPTLSRVMDWRMPLPTPEIPWLDYNGFLRSYLRMPVFSLKMNQRGCSIYKKKPWGKKQTKTTTKKQKKQTKSNTLVNKACKRLLNQLYWWTEGDIGQHHAGEALVITDEQIHEGTW